jgi:N-acetylglutamate synthase-like GNAT family acetyltransferase
VDGEPALRAATLRDGVAIEALMKQSVRDLFPRFYDDVQTASSIDHVAVLDRTLIEDGTYFVCETAGEIVACGGWSRRDKLYSGSGSGATDNRLLDPASEAARVRAMFVRADWTRRGLGRRILEACTEAARSEGFTTLALMATLPGVPLYAAFGFEQVEPVDIVLADDTVIGGAAMTRSIVS